MKKKKIYLIGNSHIDPVWQWRWVDGFAEIKATFKSVLDRLREFPDLKFTAACGSYYEWIEKSCPDMFAEIQRYVKRGVGVSQAAGFCNRIAICRAENRLLVMP